MGTVESRLEALAVTRAASRHDAETANLVYLGSEHRGDLVSSLAALHVLALKRAHGEDVEHTLDMLVAEQVEQEPSA